MHLSYLLLLNIVILLMHFFGRIAIRCGYCLPPPVTFVLVKSHNVCRVRPFRRIGILLQHCVSVASTPPVSGPAQSSFGVRNSTRKISFLAVLLSIRAILYRFRCYRESVFSLPDSSHCNLHILAGSMQHRTRELQRPYLRRVLERIPL